VTATGISRLASQVDPSHLRAIARSDQELAKLQALDLGSAVVVPVTAAGVVLGALNVVHGRRGAVDAPDLARAEMWGRRIGDALDSSRSATAHLRTGAERPTADRVWAPIGGEDNPVAAARRWVRRTLPEIVDRAVRPGLADDLDLAVSELAGNAVRHTGELLEVRLGQRGDAVRVGVLDRDDRHPTVRRPAQDSESGRGMMIIELISRSWEVEHRVREGGKLVWADLDL
jgi:anti-sigma regulatory factor (Ser/Thr protein kinase)